MSIVSETVLTYLPAKRKTTPSGWISFNAPCCHNTGSSADTRGRGGLISNPDGGVSYHCFNCGFKTSWQPGRSFSHKLRKLLQWLGAPDDVVNKVALEVMRENEGVIAKTQIAQLPKFNTVPLPEDAVKISDIVDFNKYSLAILEYMAERNLNLDDTTYYWAPSLGYRDRLIIPFYLEGNVVGWTARSILADKKPKYLTEVQPGFVYGLDEQHYKKVFCILCEGQLVCPDRDQAGLKLIEQAIDKGWSVSLPDWPAGINDIGDAVNKFGRLYTLYSIANNAESSPLKIRLRAKKWHI